MSCKKMFPTMRCLHPLFSIFFIRSLVFGHDATPDPSRCASSEYRCGDQTFEISYPFLKPTSLPYCGHPDFEVECSSDNKSLLTRIDGKRYQVNSINYGSQLVHVTDPDFLDQSCHQTFANTSISPSLFSYSSDDVNLTVLFNCRSSLELVHIFYNITCPESDSDHRSFYGLANNPFPGMVDIWQFCDLAIVPINGSFVDNLTTRNYMGNWLDLKGAVQSGYGLNWKPGDEWCRKCTDSKGICWSDPDSKNSSACHCSNGANSVNGVCVSINDSVSGKNVSKKAIFGVAVGVCFLLLCLLMALHSYKHRKIYNSVIFWKKDLTNNQKIEAFLEECGSLAPIRYSYSNVKKITKSFQEKLGQGGFGTVFKGSLSNGHLVAVKILKDSKTNGEEFINEVASIGRTSHVNIVSLLGFCFEGSKRALIYDFMRNGSLEKLLDSEKPKTTLDWKKLHEIAIGIARGLEYLHRGCNTRIVHFDIKPHNILLDQDFCPKISDFGLAKLCLQKESIISIAGARGTIGYIAPEVFSRNFGLVSSKSDVYSYGMMVLEIAGGRKNPKACGADSGSEIYFPHWIYEHLNRNGNLLSYGVTAESEETMRKMVLVGLWCIQTLPQNRPSMSRVIEMMEGNVNDLLIPPEPHLSSSPFGSFLSSGCLLDSL